MSALPGLLELLLLRRLLFTVSAAFFASAFAFSALAYSAFSRERRCAAVYFDVSWFASLPLRLIAGARRRPVAPGALTSLRWALSV